MSGRFFLLALFGVALAGDFSRGLGRGDTVRVTVPKLPAVFTGAKRASIVMEEPAPAGLPAEVLRAQIEQRLATEFTMTPTGAEMTFRIRAYFETPKSEITSATENVRVQSGMRQATDASGNPVTNPAGRPVMVPAYENKDLPVESWNGSGRLSLQVEVLGADGRAVDGFSPSQSFSRKIVVSYNGQARVDRQQLPSEAQITDALIKAVADPFLERYCRQKEFVEVRLAVDEELRKGNELAKVGQWPKAVELWRDADPRKFPGDRAHNIGVAYEATFYELYWRGEPVAKLEGALAEAKRHHDDAIVRDPKERQHQVAQERLERAASLIRKLKTPQVPPADAVPATSNPPATSNASPAAPDGVAEYRKLIRLRFRNLAVTPENEQASLEQTGMQAFQLSENDSKKILAEELASWSSVRSSLLVYKATFDSFAGDQKITRDERQVLRGLATRMRLSPEDLKLVEGTATVTEVP